MNRYRKRAIAVFLVLVMVVPLLCLSCGEEPEEGVKITLGEITDLTGPGSPALVTLHYCLEDMVRYYNEEGLIPGVKMDIVTWDNKYDPSREVPGYEWVKERGADPIIVVIPTSGPVLKPFADRDHIPLIALSTHRDTFDPPGWVFNMSNSSDMEMKTLMKWIHEDHWTGQGIPKIGLVGWNEPAIHEIKAAMETYIAANLDQFVDAGTYIVPFSTMMWSGEVEALKDCDYIAAVGFPMGAFIKAYQDAGHSKATFIDPSLGGSSYRGFLVDLLGYDRLDGTLTSNSAAFWSDNTPIVNLAKELLERYRPGQAEEAIYAGLAYCGGVQNLVCTFQIMINAIEAVGGAENFDGQAFYDAAIKFKTGGPLFEGYPQWEFTDTKRYLVDSVIISEFSASAQDLVNLSGWIPLVTD